MGQGEGKVDLGQYRWLYYLTSTVGTCASSTCTSPGLIGSQKRVQVFMVEHVDTGETYQLSVCATCRSELEKAR